MKGISQLLFSLFCFLLICSCSESSTTPDGIPSKVSNLAELRHQPCNEEYRDSVIDVINGDISFICDGSRWMMNPQSSSGNDTDYSSSEEVFSSSSERNFFSEENYSSAKEYSSSSEISSSETATSSAAYSSSSLDSYESSSSDIFEVSSSNQESSSSVSAYIIFPDTTNSSSSFESHLIVWKGKDYGSEFNEETGILTDLRDNKKYKTITIDSHTWTIDNLAFTDSTIMPYLEKRVRCSDEEGCTYTWGAAMDSVYTGCGIDNVCMDRPRQGICPSGWHIPTRKDWSQLFYAVHPDKDSIFHQLLAKYHFWGDLPENTEKADLYFWTSHSTCALEADVIFCRIGRYDYDLYNDVPKSRFMPVRCVKD